MRPRRFGLLVSGLRFSCLPIFTSPSDFACAVIALLLLPGCAAVIARNLRGGSKWAFILAAVWWVFWAAFLIRDFSRGGGFGGYAIFFGVITAGPLVFLARGILAFATYRAGGSDPLALRPYEEGLRIKKRPKFVNKSNGAAYALLLLAPVPYLWVWIWNNFRTPDLPDRQLYQNIPYLQGYQLGSFLFGLAAFYCGVRIYRRARKAAMLPGSAVVKQDARPLVLYLRSFQDDGRIKMRARTANGRILPKNCCAFRLKRS